MASAIPTPNQAGHPSPAAPPGATPTSPQNKRDLRSWWKSFKLPSKHQGPAAAHPGTHRRGAAAVDATEYRPAGRSASIRSLSRPARNVCFGVCACSSRYSPPPFLIRMASAATANLVIAESKTPGIFGVPLRNSIPYANVAISLVDENGESYIYGYVPIVVAKCGVFLKEKATGVEGIFRLSGSEKRIKELKLVFDSPDRYGKGLAWDGYTVHDAANVLRRYLNDLPEPVVPLDLYQRFRDPLRGATKQAVGDAEGPQFVDNFDKDAAIIEYQQLITELPPLNKQLLLYILDLLAVFAAKSDENRMNSQNLAAIFQPGMLSHPTHAMAPEEYRLNQCVLIFLIENQDHFLIGMQGTAADETTMKEVESGTPSVGALSPKLATASDGLERSSSNASAGANSVRRDGQLRRNRSVASGHSRQDGGSTPGSPALAAPTPTGGLGRSNTVPSKKSPALAGNKFKKQQLHSGHHSPAHVEPMTPVRPSPASNQARGSSSTGPTANPAIRSVDPVAPSDRSEERLSEGPQEPPTAPTTKDRNLQGLFQRTPTADGGDRRLPKKLKKKRIPGSLSQSAQSSSASLTPSNTASPAVEMANPMEAMHPINESVAQPTRSTPQAAPQHSAEADTQQPTPSKQTSDVSSDLTPRASHLASNSGLHPEGTLRSRKSPPTSIHSSFNESSDLDQQFGDEQPPRTAESAEKEKKRRWRMSRSRKDDHVASTSSVATPPLVSNIGSNHTAEMSTTSVCSGASRAPKSVTNDSSEPTTVASAEGQTSQDGKEESKGPIGWIRSKYREAKGNVEQRRTKSPPAMSNRQVISDVLHPNEARDDEKSSEMRGGESSTPKVTPVDVCKEASAVVPGDGGKTITDATAEPPKQQHLADAATNDSKAVVAADARLAPVPEHDAEESAAPADATQPDARTPRQE
ncbi:hypothetical protein RJ55_04159 [Drechmeria coniospora]|nr:hypothetical protein RJ55_04159 [Drechmeria coniospora]